jgi:hypothetical protein
MIINSMYSCAKGPLFCTVSVCAAAARIVKEGGPLKCDFKTAREHWSRWHERHQKFYSFWCMFEL